VLPKLVEPLSQRAVSHAQLFCDLFGLSPFDEHGTDRFIAAMIGIGWLSEENAVGGVIHDPIPRKCQLIFGKNRAEW
jgi:hypothetical protein